MANKETVVEVSNKINEEFSSKLEIFKKQVQELNDTNSTAVALKQKFDPFDEKLNDLEEKVKLSFFNLNK